MTITKALRKLYKVIVGEEAPANANTITKVLLALAEAWTGGGGSGGGGTEPLIVNITETQEDAGTVYTLDKTWREIDAAYPNVVAVRSNGEHVEKSVPYEVRAASYSSLYAVELGGFDGALETNDADGYPRIVSSGGGGY